MKKFSIFSLSLVIIVVCSLSCKKIVNKIFSGTDVGVPTIEVTIPTIPPIALSFGELPLGSFKQRFNLDSAVRANTAGAFGASVVSSVKIKTITINIPNGDDNNNLSNFESARVMISSQNNTTPVVFASLTFPTTSTNTFTNSPTEGTELLPYLKDGELTYQIFGKARKSTSKPLTMVVTVIARVK